MLLKVNIAGLAMDPVSNTPIIILKSDDGEHAVPIWIGLLEATSIASALQKVKFERPMTHDLFKNFVELVNVKVSRIEVYDLIANTYYARIHFTSGTGHFDMDSRPSDAIAIALRFDAPIFLDDKVIEKSKGIEDKPEMVDTSEEGKMWADYLENLSPDDFGKFKV
ncbi:bifunctional nuclease family protein [Desulfobacterium sp. N47]|uniref:BFN domain-containing protein n=1 Tax=uncultured Desulfobacterium sp. TaxID=201089 RepID=E1YDK7_9BACT|nr:hypothetical protein N47_G39750 [uncultured Desulfobacterium sp.]